MCEDGLMKELVQDNLAPPGLLGNNAEAGFEHCGVLICKEMYS